MLVIDVLRVMLMCTSFELTCSVATSGKRVLLDVTHIKPCKREDLVIVWEKQDLRKAYATLKGMLWDSICVRKAYYNAETVTARIRVHRSTDKWGIELIEVA